MLILTQEQPDTCREALCCHTESEEGTFCIQRGFDVRLNVLFYHNALNREKMPWGIVATFPYGKGEENSPDCLENDFIERHNTALAAAKAFIAQAVRENLTPEGFAKESGIPKAFEQKPYGEYVLEESERFYEGDGQYGRGEFMANPGSYPAVAEYRGGRLTQVRVHLKSGRWTELNAEGEHTAYIPAWAIPLTQHLIEARA